MRGGKVVDFVDTGIQFTKLASFWLPVSSSVEGRGVEEVIIGGGERGNLFHFNASPFHCISTVEV